MRSGLVHITAACIPRWLECRFLGVVRDEQHEPPSPLCAHRRQGGAGKVNEAHLPAPVGGVQQAVSRGS